MTTRIWPMPNIEFKPCKIANCLYFLFERHENNEVKVFIESCYGDIEDYTHFYLAENQTFEQAVTEWVIIFVKQNFEPIVVPEMYPHTEYGVLCKLLELNPNAIVEDV